MPGALEMGERHDADQIAGVETLRGGIEPLVERDGASLDRSSQTFFI